MSDKIFLIKLKMESCSRVIQYLRARSLKKKFGILKLFTRDIFLLNFVVVLYLHRQPAKSRTEWKLMPLNSMQKFFHYKTIFLYLHFFSGIKRAAETATVVETRAWALFVVGYMLPILRWMIVG